MPIPATITQADYDALPEDVRTQAYRPGDTEGTFVADITPADGLELVNPSSLRSALQTERGRTSTLQSQLDVFGDLNPEVARQAIQTVEQLGDWGDDEKRSAAVQAHARPLIEAEKAKTTAAEKRAELRDKQLRRLLVEDRGRSALLEAGFDAEGADVVLPHFMGRLRPVELENGELDVQTWDPATDARLVGDDGNTVGLTALASKLLKEPRFARNAPGVNRDGTGSQQGSRRPATQGGKKVISRTDQKAMNENWEGIRDGSVVVVD